MDEVVKEVAELGRKIQAEAAKLKLQITADAAVIAAANILAGGKKAK